MKTITFSAIFYLALSTLNALGMDGKPTLENPEESPVTSSVTVNFDSAATSPIRSMVNSPIMPKNTVDFAQANDNNAQEKRRNYNLDDESDKISWNDLDSQIAQNYEKLKHVFAKLENAQEKSVSAKPKKKVRIQDYDDSSSDDDSDIERMLNN